MWIHHTSYIINKFVTCNHSCSFISHYYFLANYIGFKVWLWTENNFACYTKEFLNSDTGSDRRSLIHVPAGSGRKHLPRSQKQRKNCITTSLQGLLPIINICAFPFKGVSSWQECKLSCRKKNVNSFCTEVSELSYMKPVTKIIGHHCDWVEPLDERNDHLYTRNISFTLIRRCRAGV